MREVMLLTAMAGLGVYFMVHPREYHDLLVWITKCLARNRTPGRRVFHA